MSIDGSNAVPKEIRIYIYKYIDKTMRWEQVLDQMNWNLRISADSQYVTGSNLFTTGVSNMN